MNGNGAAALRIRGATDEPPDGRANTGSFKMLPPSSTPESTTPAAAAYSLPPPIITQEGQAARRRGRLLDTDGSLVAEDDEGAVEYKWRLTNISATRFEHLKTQMQFRVAEGHGQCLYELGVADNGTPRGLTTGDFDESVDTVRRMAESLGYDLRIIFERVVETTPELLRCVELMVTKKLTACDQTDLRIAFCGETDTGKSTLVSVLVHGTLDDGTGVARQGMFNHKHEVTSGQTSSVSRRVLGFDETGRVTNYDVLEEKSGGGVADVYGGAHLCAAMNTTRTIAERSVKLVTLMDLGGARRYRKTALLSMTSRMPGYACICARIDRVLRDVEQYLILCRALRIPCFVVLTKADTVSELEIDDAVFELQDMIEHRFSLKMLRVEGDDEVSLAISALASSTATSPVRPSTVAVDNNNSAVDNDVSTSASVTPTDDVTDSPSTTPTTFTRIGGQDQQRIVPVFVMSSVEGTGVESLKLLLHGLPIPPPSQPHQLGGAVPSALPVIPSTNSLGSSLSGSKVTAALAASSPTTTSAAKRSGSIEVLLDGVLTVPRVGTVVCGFVAKGIVHLHDTLSIGPDRKGQFHSVSVEGIHVKGSHVTYATSGLEVTIAIRHVSTTVPIPSTLSLSRKGNILVDLNASPNVCIEFDMEVVSVLAHGTHAAEQASLIGEGDSMGAPTNSGPATSVRSIAAQQEPIVHTRNIRQAARIMNCAPRPVIPYEEAVGAVLHCKFLYNAEVLDVGATVLLRWNRDAKLMGLVTAIHPMTPTTSPALRPEAFPPLMFDGDEGDGELLPLN